MIQNIYMIFMLHALGDYVLQSSFLADTKGKSWWSLLMHCFLYTLPFIVYFNFDYRIIILFISHIIIDALKARYKEISYTTDQILHLIILFFIYM